MGNLLDAQVRQELVNRLERLTPEASARWGRLTVELMLVHLIDAFEITFAEKEVQVQKGFFSTAFGRWVFFLLVKMPIPRGKVKAPAIFFQTKPGDFNTDRQRVIEYIQRFSQGDAQSWGASPILGTLSPRRWAKLHAVHTHHHLAQFGV